MYLICKNNYAHTLCLWFDVEFGKNEKNKKNGKLLFEKWARRLGIFHQGFATYYIHCIPTSDTFLKFHRIVLQSCCMCLRRGSFPFLQISTASCSGGGRETWGGMGNPSTIDWFGKHHFCSLAVFPVIYNSLANEGMIGIFFAFHPFHFSGWNSDKGGIGFKRRWRNASLLARSLEGDNVIVGICLK